MPAKKPPRLAQPVTPRPAPFDVPAGPETAPAVLSGDRAAAAGLLIVGEIDRLARTHAIADPGPPPRMPQPPPAAGEVGERLAQEGETQDRDSVQAVDVLRAGPAAAQYKAELLHWLDALDAHGALRG